MNRDELTAYLDVMVSVTHILLMVGIALATYFAFLAPNPRSRARWAALTAFQVASLLASAARP